MHVDALGQNTLSQLPSDQRSIVEAILARSPAETASAQALELALALIHVRASGATACLLETLERAVVYVLLENPDDWQTVLILETETGCPHLAAFTSEAHAAIAVQEYGGRYVITAVDAVLLCRSLKGSLGFAMNAHDHVLAFEISPEIFGHFRQVLQDRSLPVAGAFYSMLAGEPGYHVARIDQLGESLTLTWIETAFVMRPATVSRDIDQYYPSERCEVSSKAFQRWLPIRIQLTDSP